MFVLPVPSVLTLLLVSVLAACSQPTSPYYGVSVSPASVSAGLGDRATTTLSLVSRNGFAGTLEVSLLDGSGQPAAGFTVSPKAVTLAAGQNLATTITVTPSGSVPAGTYDLGLNTSGGGVPRAGPLSLTLTSGATGSF